MKRQNLFKSMLCLLLGLVCNVAWAALGNTKTGTPENGKKYYIYADTYSGGAYVNRYLYNGDGSLKMNAAVDESSDYYVWTCTVTDGKYTFQNVGDNTKWLGHKELSAAAYNFTLGKATANHEGTTIWSDGASRYLVAKNDGTAFDQSTGTYDQTTGSWCTDYVFVEYVEPTGSQLSVTANYAGAGEVCINGTATTLPYTKWANTVTLPITLTATANSPYTFLGFYSGDTNLGTEYEITSLASDVSIEARYSLDIFSADLNNLVPVRVYNNRDKGYAIKMNAADSYTSKAVNSGSSVYGENEIWYLVGTAESFKMYSRTAGTSLAVTLDGTGSGSAATLTATGTDLCLIAQSDGGFGICPVGTTEQSFNMHGGAGQNIKLYATSGGGSKWLFKRVDVSRPLSINYTAQTEGGYEQNYKIGELVINVDGATSTTMLEKTTIPASSGTMYLPEGAVFGISTGFMCHGWTMDINGDAAISEQTLPEGGLTANVNIAVDTDNKYQYLYYSPGPNGKPYRIPALTTTANGYVFAINDYRPCGNDIGYGEVDLVMRHSTAAGSEWDGYSWTESVTIADGQGYSIAANDTSLIWKVGFGDPAIVADRESNEILVMSVCGNRTCWDGNYGSGTDENPENPNRVARLYITFNEETQKWEVGEPEEVTYSLYPIFKDSEGTVHSSSMFIGAGRIAQSSKIKVGTHYRIYCAVWTVTMTNRQHHNYAIYSDDFGKTWNLLGELGYDNCPSKWGNEPKCEELPDGSVLLSSRKSSGRYFNVFRYTNVRTGEGYWEGEVSTNDVGDLAWGNNSTNGEPILVGNVLFQSAPTGPKLSTDEARSRVSIFYKVLSNDAAEYTPTKLSSGWTEINISDKYSAYSSMALLPDKETLAIFYEEAPGGYSMVYLPLTLKEVLPADVYAATQEKRELSVLIGETESLIAQCSERNYAEVTLSTTEGQNYYIWSNAPQADSPVANLLDNTASTFFHSNWENAAAPADGLDHHLTVELGENAVSLFKFHYQARSGSGLGDYPKTIKVQGSNDGETYTDIATVEPRNANGGIIENGAEWTSGELGAIDTSYTYLRFMVTATTTNKNKDGHIFWHMAEFDLMPLVETGSLATSAIAKAEEAVATAKEALSATQTTEEYEASIAALQLAYDELEAAMASGDLPVLVTTDVNNPIVYKIGSKRGDTKVLQFDLASKMVAVADYSEGNTAQGWYFTKGSAEGKVFIHPYIGGSDVLSASSTSNSPAAVWAAAKGEETHQEWTLAIVDATNGTYNIKAGDGSNYFSNNGGVTNKMGFWNGSPSSDGGSLFIFTRMDFDSEVWHNTLTAYNTFAAAESYPEGDALGYYSNATAYTTAKAAATAMLADEFATEAGCRETYVALRAANEAVVFNVPQTGKFYRFKGKASSKYMKADAERNKMKLSSDASEAGCIFYLTEGNKLLNYELGTYLCNTHDCHIMGEGNGNIVYFNPSESGNGGYFTLKTDYSGSKYIYDDKNDDEVDRNSSYAVDNCEWTIEEVTELPVTIGATGYATLHAPVALTIPAGVKAYTGALEDDRLTLDDVGTTIPANTAVILEGTATTYNFAIITAEEFAGVNSLVGTVAAELKGENRTVYTLQSHESGVAFKKYTGTNLKGFRAYLVLESNAAAIRITRGGDEETTGIETTANGEQTTVIYDLAGRRVEKMEKGIYIVNGKKVVIR